MPRIRFDFGGLTLEAELLDTPTAKAIAIGFGRTPVSRGDEIRLASPVNIWAKMLSDVKALKAVKAGTRVTVSAVD